MTALLDTAGAVRGELPAAFWRAVRPTQWVKNALVFAAPGAAGVLFDPRMFVGCALSAVAITAVASGCYLVNDVRDRELDRAHPRKRRRPVASGALPVRLALAGAVVLLIGGLLIAAAGPVALLVVVGAYAALTLLYSAGLKAVPWLEMAVVAAGFVLRAVAGAAAARVPVSVWFLLVVTAAAVLVVASKRHSEIHDCWADPGLVRPVLRSYTGPLLRHVRWGSGAALVLAYLGWVLSRQPDLAGVFAALSALPVIAVVVSWLRQTDRGRTGAPEEVLMRDRGVRTGVLLWAATFGASVLAAALPG